MLYPPKHGSTGISELFWQSVSLVHPPNSKPNISGGWRLIPLCGIIPQAVGLFVPCTHGVVRKTRLLCVTHLNEEIVLRYTGFIWDSEGGEVRTDFATIRNYYLFFFFVFPETFFERWWFPDGYVQSARRTVNGLRWYRTWNAFRNFAHLLSHDPKSQNVSKRFNWHYTSARRSLV